MITCIIEPVLFRHPVIQSIETGWLESETTTARNVIWRAVGGRMWRVYYSIHTLTNSVRHKLKPRFLFGNISKEYFNTYRLTIHVYKVK
jgi:hypothetical protein